MKRNTRIGASVLVAILAVTTGTLYRSTAQDKTPGAAPDEKKVTPDEAAVRKSAAEFAEAFNKGNAREVAAFWAKDGEFITADGETVRGREKIEKSYAARTSGSTAGRWRSAWTAGSPAGSWTRTTARTPTSTSP